MGIPYIQGQVKGPKGKAVEVSFLVDSGVTYSVLPKETWQALCLVFNRFDRTLQPMRMLMC